MSMTLFLLLSAGMPLNTNALNAATKKFEPIAVYEANVDLSSHTGYLPVVLGGEKTGVEIYKIQYSEIGASLPPNKLIDPKSTVVIEFRWGSDMREGATAFYTAALLSATYNGIAYEPSGNVYLTTEQLKQGYMTFLSFVK